MKTKESELIPDSR